MPHLKDNRRTQGLSKTNIVIYQFGVILWKNAIIRLRHWILTILELFVPIVFFLLLAYGHYQTSGSEKERIKDPTYSRVYSSKQIYTGKNFKSIYYTPELEFSAQLMERVGTKLDIQADDIKGFENETILLKEYAKNVKDKSIIILVFPKLNSRRNPKRLKFEIRAGAEIFDWNTNRPFYAPKDYVPDRVTGQSMKRSLPLELAVNTAFIEYITNSAQDAFTFQDFPYPPYPKIRTLHSEVMQILPFITLLSFIFLCPAVLQRIVEEKHSGIKELMKMAGVQSWMIWLGWFLHAFVVALIAIIVIVIAMKTPLFSNFPVIEFCSTGVYFAFLILYCIACIFFCFTIAAMFSSPIIALIVGLLMVLLTDMVPFNIIQSYPNMNWIGKMLLALLPNVAMRLGYSAIALYEYREIEVNWRNIGESAGGDDDDVTMGDALLMLFLDSIFYLLLALYIDDINPGPYGFRKPWYFPIAQFIVCFKKKKSRKKVTVLVHVNFENPPLNLTPSIEIRDLHKNYGKLEVVKGVSLDIYKDQITVLLGHNGAGKSTTMSMITGLIRPTQGTVKIMNIKSKNKSRKFTKTMGFCPQHNLLFVNLTVMEHVLFFGMLRGLTLSQVRTDSADLLKRLGLYEKRFKLPNKLSGGMKRKLCLGMAIVGNSEILVLDEPTTEMDPEARRAVWDLLLLYRTSRTILVTTQFMEEAEVLGDRIAIMAQGIVVCYGTPLYLKNKYATGYNLTILRSIELYSKGDKQSEDKRNEMQLQEILNEVKSVIPSAKVKEKSGNAVTFNLPMESKPLFFKMLSNLEDKRQSLGIENISVSITNLEDLMLRVDSSNDTNLDHDGSTLGFHLIKCDEPASFWTQVAVLLRKRWYVFLMKIVLHIIQCIVMIVVILLTLYIAESSNSKQSALALKMNLGIYGSSTVYYSSQDDLVLPEIGGYYNKTVRRQRRVAVKTDQVSDALISDGTENIINYEKNLITAAEFNKIDDENLAINVMFSNFAIHGASISLNLAANALLKAVARGHSLSTTLVKIQQSKTAYSLTPSALIWLVVVFPFAVLFMVCGLLIFPHLEKSSNIVHLQYMTGIKSYTYWLTTFVFDFCYYTIAILLMVFCIQIYTGFISKSHIYYGSYETVALLMIFLCYGIAVIPYTYLFSYKRSLASALALHLIISLFLGFILTITIHMLLISDHRNVENKLRYLFDFFPHFGLIYAIINFNGKFTSNYNWDNLSETEKEQSCLVNNNPCCEGEHSDECQAHSSYFQGNNYAVGLDLLVMVISAFIYFAILLFLDSRLLGTCKDKISVACVKIKERKSPKKWSTQTSTDGLGDKEALLEVRNLEKLYWTKKVVDGVTFSVKPGVCFGLLGVNGAGKTTTFKMLTGEQTMTKGSVFIRLNSDEYLSVADDTVYCLSRMGYCPQFDSINDLLTGRQMLVCFARLRGVPKSQVAYEVNILLDLLGLTEYADKACGKYSGGNKRKLSIAIALIGRPPLLLLDEPTSGVDPASRRKMWTIISYIKENSTDTSIILTSHSMQECEVLCNSLAIMKNGKIFCQGTLPRLKERFGKGYTVLLKFNCSGDTEEVVMEDEMGNVSKHTLTGNATERTMREVKKEMYELYGSNCRLKDQHKCLLHYRIESANKKWSTLFKEIENLKSRFPIIEDYAISDASLEDVFLEIAKSS